MLNADYDYGHEVIDQVLDRALPALNPWDLWRNSKVSDAENPVRDVEAVEDVRANARPLSAIVAGIYRATFFIGPPREILVWGDPTERDFDSAVFLKPGRTSNVLAEIKGLIINEPGDAVPDSVKDKLRFYEARRDQAANALKASNG